MSHEPMSLLGRQSVEDNMDLSRNGLPGDNGGDQPLVQTGGVHHHRHGSAAGPTWIAAGGGGSVMQRKYDHCLAMYLSLSLFFEMTHFEKQAAQW